MKNLHEEHIEITREVKEAIKGIKVVFPAYYGKLYSEKAHLRDIELKPDELLTNEMLDEKIVRHIITLSNCADQAILAIETQDKMILQAVLSETRKLQEEIQELQKFVYEDSLTKSYNRKWFEDTVLEHDHITLRESGTIAMVDLNKFKEINDTYGHIVGDKVLIHIALKLKETGGRVVRYGGDEFLIIFDAGTSSRDIDLKLSKLLQYFDKIHFKVEKNSFKISFAYGIASFTRGADIPHVIEAADKAMYKHKKSS
ncbi:GGDEF domain-containing protein [Sulfuricurvum sp.]|uniref:GGDEF domain-containing protein n=1 Tax=Sulfuricurvum sp. TaxID=2025608 RepID=UPI002625B406|nr:GGDEF domain-containing protein [Sulfuricurvum sp.]MDD2837418.1 GGDEF domain-containing protein [Sulfuricurvum sp.]MDD3596099.1 GGDEF domain-containing protein [Sulfuricurvum sp.]MDD4883907.1 GGDEF domain-containing protein [Sulfuricurvum sp.]